jgi:hypothetical protein
MTYIIPFKTKNKQSLSSERKNVYARIKSRAAVLSVFVLTAGLGNNFSFVT